MAQLVQTRISPPHAGRRVRGHATGRILLAAAAGAAGGAVLGALYLPSIVTAILGAIGGALFGAVSVVRQLETA